MREPIEKLNKDYVPPKEHTLEFKETDHPSCPPRGGKVFFDSWKHFKSNNITGSLFDDDYAFVVRFDIIGPDKDGDVLVSINGKNEYINEHHVSPL